MSGKSKAMSKSPEKGETSEPGPIKYQLRHTEAGCMEEIEVKNNSNEPHQVVPEEVMNLKEQVQDAPANIAPTEEKSEHICNVCFEEVEGKFGILPNCKHCFCYDCIKKWRQTEGLQINVTKGCPVCRRKSNFVYVSNCWIQTEEQKKRLIKKQQKILATIPCKNFKNGKGHCAQGSRCKFSHFVNVEVVKESNKHCNMCILDEIIQSLEYPRSMNMNENELTDDEVDLLLNIDYYVENDNDDQEINDDDEDEEEIQEYFDDDIYYHPVYPYSTLIADSNNVLHLVTDYSGSSIGNYEDNTSDHSELTLSSDELEMSGNVDLSELSVENEENISGSRGNADDDSWSVSSSSLEELNLDVYLDGARFQSNINEIDKSEQKSNSDGDGKGSIFGQVVLNSAETSAGGSNYPIPLWIIPVVVYHGLR